MLLTILLWTVTGINAYIPGGKDDFMTGVFLREIVDRMSKDLPSDGAPFMDFPGDRLPLGVRSLNRNEELEQLYPLDYDLGDSNMHPSIRDQEFLEHSSLYGSQFVSGGAGEGKQRLKPEGSVQNVQEVKSDSTLPAYCNPPNPCPVGYTGEQGCIEDFENTASFSRRYQGAQDCMCDTEHMFECTSLNESEELDEFNDLDFNRFLQRTMNKINPSFEHKNLVAKKFHRFEQASNNPFLSGERLPVAAKKGNNVLF